MTIMRIFMKVSGAILHLPTDVERFQHQGAKHKLCLRSLVNHHLRSLTNEQNHPRVEVRSLGKSLRRIPSRESWDMNTRYILHWKVYERQLMTDFSQLIYHFIYTGTWTVTFISDKYCRYPPTQPDMVGGKP